MGKSAPETIEGVVVANLATNIKVDPEYDLSKTFFGRYENAWHPQGGVIKTALNYATSYVPYRLTHRKPKLGKAPATEPFDLNAFLAQDYGCSVISHSTVAIKIGDSVTLIDPVMTKNAGTFVFTCDRKVPVNCDIAALAPHVTAVCLTHDHRDHMCKDTLRIIEAHGKPLYFVGVGSSSILLSWGIDGDRVQELTWWDSAKVTTADLSITFVPAQHWGMRSLFDKNKRLWGGFVVGTIDHDRTVYHAGDSGFDERLFLEIARLGPFDMAFMPIGDGTPQSIFGYQHMNAKQAIQATDALKPTAAVAMHYGCYLFKAVFESLTQPERDLLALPPSTLTPSTYGAVQPISDTAGGGASFDVMIQVSDLRPGDLVLFKGMEIYALDRLIMDLTDSDVCHCAVYTGESLVVEEEMDGARRSKIWDAEDGRPAYVMRPKYSGTLDMQPVIDEANKYTLSNNPYGYDSILWLALLLLYRRFSPSDGLQTALIDLFEDAAYRIHELIERIFQGDEDTLVCSEFVYKVYNSAPGPYQLSIVNGVINKDRSPESADKTLFEQMVDTLDRDIETVKQMAGIAKQAILDDPIKFVTDKLHSLWHHDKTEEGADVSNEVSHAVIRVVSAFLGISPGPEIKEHLGRFQEMVAYLVTPEDLKHNCPELEQVGIIKLGHDTINRYNVDGEIIE